MSAGNVTILCQLLLSGVCNNYQSSFPAAFGSLPNPQGFCEDYFNHIVGALGHTSDTNVNTIGCRQNYAQMAQSQTATAPYYCKFASLSGGGVCGLAVNNTCNAVTWLCNGNSYNPYNVSGQAGCVSDLTPQLAAVFGSNQGTAAQYDNSLECRIYHAIAANNTLAPNSVHCSHIPAASPTCVNATIPVADHYCGLIELTCTGNSYQQYYTPATGFDPVVHFTSCSNSIAQFPVGPGVPNATGNTGNNDFSSRFYHVSVNANNGGNTAAGHCSHAGPSGGGVCGGATSSRLAWLLLAKTPICNGTGNAYIYLQIAEAMQQWGAQLLQVVPQDPNISTYSVAVGGPALNYDSCRIYHLTAAATNASAHCVHGSILGGGVCPSDTTIPLCAMIAQACPSAYTAAGSCKSAFTPYLTQAKMGNPCGALQGAPPADDSLACRVLHATNALISVGSNQTASASDCMNAQILGATGCNVSALPPAKSGAAPQALFAGLTLFLMLW